MIVIGLDVHKQSVTAVAVDEAGRPLEEKVIVVGSDALLDWAAVLDDERLWAVEDCRQLTRWLERQLLEQGEDLVRVPPKLTVPERRAGRTRGKSDPIDALAIARAAIREPNLSRPRADERVYREIKLLVDHREDLVDQRRRTQQRLRWHPHQLDPTYAVPLRMLSRASHLERVSRWLARREQELQVRLARELVTTIRALNRAIGELDQELEQRTAEVAPALLELPGCAAVTAAKLLAEIGPIDRFKSDAQLARHSGVAPLEASSGKSQRHRLDRGGNRQLNAALYRIAITQARYYTPARDYLDRKRAEGKSRREALRCLKRLLVRVVFNTLKNEPRLDIGATLAQPCVVYRERMNETERQRRYRDDARVLGEIGAILALTDLPAVTVRLPSALAQAALKAWQRDEETEVDAESYEQRAIRHRAGALGLIGLSIEQSGRDDGDAVVVELSPDLIGSALMAADDLSR